MSHRLSRTVSGPVGVCAALTLMTSACTSSTTGSGAAPIPSTSRARAATTPPVLHVSVSGTHFRGLPATVPAGTVTLAFRNDTTGPHMAALGRLATPHSGADLLAYLATPAARRGLPPWLSLIGGVDEIDGGHRASWTGELSAGRYVLVSLSADRQGRPEASDGMIASFTTRSGSSTTHTNPAAVRAGATVSLGRAGTLRMTQLRTGSTSLKVVNTDQTTRTVDVTAIRPGKTFADVMAEARRGNGVPPSLIRLGGTSVAPGQVALVGIEAAAAGTTYVVFDIDHVAQGAIVHETAT